MNEWINEPDDDSYFLFIINKQNKTHNATQHKQEVADVGKDTSAAGGSASAKDSSSKKGHYVGIHASGFKDFLLKPELLRAIVDAGFEHPSEVQHESIPQAVLGGDIVCQAKSGMGKTAVFVLATLHQLNPTVATTTTEGDGGNGDDNKTTTATTANNVQVLVLCHTRELAFQIAHEYERFSKYLPSVKTAVFYGGVNIKTNREILKNDHPHIVVGTPGRILALAREKTLKLSGVKHFVLDECDRVLEALDMRRDVQEIFRMTPHDKQVLLFSATLSKEIRPVCKKFCQDPVSLSLPFFLILRSFGLRSCNVISFYTLCVQSAIDPPFFFLSLFATFVP